MTTHYESKPGWLTTEFVLTVVALLLVAIDAITWEQALVVVGPYALSRGIAKHGIPQTFTEQRTDLEDAEAEEAREKLGASGLPEGGTRLGTDPAPPAPTSLGTLGPKPWATTREEL